MKAVLFDVDSKIPNLALMKLSGFYKSKGYHTLLSKKPRRISADLYFAGAVFNSDKSLERIKRLKELYGKRSEGSSSRIVAP